MTDLVRAAKEAAAIARGEEPAPRITINGHAYVPEAAYKGQSARIERLEAALLTIRDNRTKCPRAADCRAVADAALQEIQK